MEKYGEPKCPSTKEHLNELWKASSIEFHTAIRNNKQNMYILNRLKLKIFFHLSESSTGVRTISVFSPLYTHTQP